MKKIKYVEPSIYNKDFFLNCCLGSDEFKKSKGKKLHPKVLELISKIKIDKNSKILDIGCGRGDITLFLAKNAIECIGTDYSKDAIDIAKCIKKNYPRKIQKKVLFKVMNAKKISYPNSYFDIVVCIDVFEHLYKEELEIAMSEISRVLKKDGTLFARTVTNKILYDFTYKFYMYPMNKLLTWIDKKIKNTTYDSFPKEPRIPEEKIQHVNEPTYYYLKDLFRRYNFNGAIEIEIGYLKKIKNIKTVIYNFMITLYPLSKLFPLNLLFGWAFICKMKNNKPEN
ncbi:MAG: hypothetical protein A2857_01195 [Candidatus Levybacteria bacterium RIFCSPHIGHO2_01_FULL_36_15]|nr:MAG: hypothetical protein A2857_01195 [Candidatus Levybacteria bacterium RIFCSPHIGHO2_01_FULL_36_15]